MKQWLVSIISVCLLFILLELMLSEGKTKKYIVGILRIGIVITILSPIVSFLQKPFPNMKKKPETIAISEVGTQSLSIYFKETTEKIIEKNLNSYGGICEVQIDLENETIKTIKVFVKNGINPKGENIYTNEKIIKCILEIIDVKKENIFIYGTG